MKIEDIEKAAVNYDSRAVPFRAFVAGAEWRINSVWRDVDKELPEYNRHIVNEDWFDFTAKDEKDLKRIMKRYPFKKWAYVEDLKPNTKECL